MRFLYVTWDGPGHPYLESLFWPVLAKLQGFSFDVLQASPERTRDTEPVRRLVESQGGQYHHVRLIPGARALAAPLAILGAARLIRKLVRIRGYQGFLIRSNLPAAIMELLRSELRGKILIFDADGFVQDERVEFGGWSAQGPAYIILRELEARAARDADAVLVRTEKAREILAGRAGPDCDPEKFFLVANGRDEASFHPEPGDSPGRPPRIFFAGSVGPQYCPREMLDFFRRVLARRPEAELDFCTPQVEEARELVRNALGPDSRVKIRHLRGEALERTMRSADLGLALRVPSFSMQAVSPIKCGEYLLSGLPILLVRGIGDLDRQLGGSAACHFLPDLSAQSLDRAAEWFHGEVLPARARFREEARRLGLAHYSFAATLQSYQKALEFAVRRFRDFRAARPHRRRPRTAYVSHDGMLEPLGESQVVAYLEGLARRWEVDLFSFEKPVDFADPNRLAQMRQRLASAGIRWHPLRYHRQPGVLATSYDIMRCAMMLAGQLRIRGISIVHARGYVSSLISRMAIRGERCRFLFDMRGFWADEKVDGGQWRRNSWLYWITKRAERSFLRRADAVVLLTRAGLNALPQLDAPLAPGVKPAVISTCTDLNFFFPKSRRRAGQGPRTIGLSGTISNWYLRSEMLSCLALLQRRWPQARILAVSREEESLLRRDAAAAGIDPARFLIRRANFREMPDWLNEMDLGLFFIRRCFSKTGSAATKLGEFLACGVPVVINDGIGDSGEIVRNERVGLVLAEPATAELDRRCSELEALLADPATSARCRQAAERHFNLQDGICSYNGIYEELLESAPNSQN